MDLRVIVEERDPVTGFRTAEGHDVLLQEMVDDVLLPGYSVPAVMIGNGPLLEPRNPMLPTPAVIRLGITGLEFWGMFGKRDNLRIQLAKTLRKSGVHNPETSNPGLLSEAFSLGRKGRAADFGIVSFMPISVLNKRFVSVLNEFNAIRLGLPRSQEEFPSGFNSPSDTSKMFELMDIEASGRLVQPQITFGACPIDTAASAFWSLEQEYLDFQKPNNTQECYRHSKLIREMASQIAEIRATHGAVMHAVISLFRIKGAEDSRRQLESILTQGLDQYIRTFEMRDIRAQTDESIGDAARRIACNRMRWMLTDSIEARRPGRFNNPCRAEIRRAI
ncbi:hypothetical protein KJ766_00070, partial [Patescibacteria group bacterium]|nr:hypothetical protein [Patescibacteria group bacterium]